MHPSILHNQIITNHSHKWLHQDIIRLNTWYTIGDGRKLKYNMRLQEKVITQSYNNILTAVCSHGACYISNEYVYVGW